MKTINNNHLFKQTQILSKKSFKQQCIKFFFPFYPIKWSHSVHLITVLASLIAFRLVTQFFSIPIGPTLRISFNWIPAATIGWIFGPVVGFFVGIVTDSITFFISGGIWFWMYAIQEPLIMMLSGIIGSIYNLRKNEANWFYDYLAFQLASLAFLIVGIVVLIRYSQMNLSKTSLNPLGLEQRQAAILTLVCLIVFFTIVQILLHITLFRNKKRNIKPRLFLYVSLLSVLLSIIFSFVLGTIAAINYYYFISGSVEPPSNLVTYGSYYYLIPRVVKETFKMPFITAILMGIIKISEPNLAMIKQMKYQKW